MPIRIGGFCPPAGVDSRSAPSLSLSVSGSCLSWSRTVVVMHGAGSTRRGLLQEGLEHIQYGITDYLTDASAPISLRSAVATASQTRFLLITAGKVNDERRAAAFIRAGATERVTT
jgi:hypothetical protein